MITFTGIFTTIGIILISLLAYVLGLGLYDLEKTRKHNKKLIKKMQDGRK